MRPIVNNPAYVSPNAVIQVSVMVPNGSGGGTQNTTFRGGIMAVGFQPRANRLLGARCYGYWKRYAARCLRAARRGPETALLLTPVSSS